MSTRKKLKTIVIMPAYNAEVTLEKTIADIPFDFVDEIILVDDASKDNTVKHAIELGNKNSHLTLSKEEYKKNPTACLLTIAVHTKNKGYGGNQKKCYELALDHGADIIIMIHPDYQYDPKIIKYLVEFIEDRYFDVMLGSRIRSRKEALAGGMPRYKYFTNRALSFVENMATSRVISDWHTGMRAYSRDVLLNIPYKKFSDDFIFDTQMLFAIIEREYTIGDIPIPVRYFADSSSINFQRGMRYGILTIWETIKYTYRKRLKKK
jgi:glycosyltransferase involved in cell wall biosynthesis